MKRPTHNPALPFILEGWQGNPLTANGQYCNLDGPSERSFTELLRWQTQKNPLKALKQSQRPLIDVVHNPLIAGDRITGITWLGHASFLVAAGGKQLLTDPVLHNVSIVKRQTPLPLPIDKLRPVDYILLSHNHRDHCDQRSLLEVTTLNPKAVILTGLGITPLLRRWKIHNPVIEAGWYQSYQLEEDFDITYLPAKHWNRRGLYDTNEMLWGSMMITTREGNIYFGADSGLGAHFAHIGALYPIIDIAMLGIGAYKPEWFMHTAHTSPADALQAMQQLRARQLIPMHHGTFDLSDEPVFYPKQELLRLQEEQGILQVQHMNIGSKFYL